MKSAILVLASAACLAGGCGRQPAPPPAPPSPKVEGQTVAFPPGAPQLASLAVNRAEPRRVAIAHMTGRLYWADDATVRVFSPVSGQVREIKAEVGQRVSAGAPLAVVSSPDFGQALADARTASANLAAADRAYDRAKDLFSHGAAAEKDVEAAQAADVAAQAEKDRTQSRLKLYGGTDTERDEDYVLRSPVAGVVVEKNINPGQEVRNDQMLANAPSLFAPLFVISNPAKLWLQLDAAEPDLPSLHPGQALRIRARAFPGAVFTGTVDQIGEELDPATRTVKVRGVVDNRDRQLKAEMYVSSDVVEDEAGAARAGVDVPAKAVFAIGDRNYLFVERSPGNFQRREVATGAERDGLIPVTSGVAAGERVVTEGALLLEAVLEPAD